MRSGLKRVEGEESLFPSERDGVPTGADAKLPLDVLGVRLHRVLSYAESRTDFLVIELPPRQIGENLSLAGREAPVRRGRAALGNRMARGDVSARVTAFGDARWQPRRNLVRPRRRTILVHGLRSGFGRVCSPERDRDERHDPKKRRSGHDVLGRCPEVQWRAKEPTNAHQRRQSADGANPTCQGATNSEPRAGDEDHHREDRRHARRAAPGRVRMMPTATIHSIAAASRRVARRPSGEGDPRNRPPIRALPTSSIPTRTRVTPKSRTGKRPANRSSRTTAV